VQKPCNVLLLCKPRQLSTIQDNGINVAVILGYPSSSQGSLFNLILQRTNLCTYWSICNNHWLPIPFKRALVHLQAMKCSIKILNGHHDSRVIILRRPRRKPNRKHWEFHNCSKHNREYLICLQPTAPITSIFNCRT
jgi:hypothetical protein